MSVLHWCDIGVTYLGIPLGVCVCVCVGERERYRSSSVARGAAKPVHHSHRQTNSQMFVNRFFDIQGALTKMPLEVIL